MASNQGNQGNQGSQGGGSGRGFAGMDPERQREIAAEGGRAAHASGNAYEFNSGEARRAGSMSHGGGNNNQQNSSGSSQNSGGTRGGGSSEQHAQAGRQSHKNDR
ncbi:KGG domain-containing protein [Paracidovorax cattleyae]|uniref:KGG domain-containing protein n=1 Tax=Paracidovorax cattleyae TaxID=80868 RepID=UPI0018AF9E2A|nr:KGG domain-containing protein [Paracidovorax cattleyae]MBF9266087.1 stress-induced protein [Paracidovorax cattleyae]